MATRGYCGRILHNIIDITEDKRLCTLSQQGNSYCTYSVELLSEKLDEMVEGMNEESIYTQWYDIHLSDN